MKFAELVLISEKEMRLEPAGSRWLRAYISRARIVTSESLAVKQNPRLAALCTVVV
jgi:hypothetical protein